MKCDANSFELNANNADNDEAYIGSNCSLDYIYIEASNQGNEPMLEDRYCGGIFNNVNGSMKDAKIKDCTAPFQVGVVTDNMLDGVPATCATCAGAKSGVCLEYTQEPCGAPDQGP